MADILSEEEIEEILMVTEDEPSFLEKIIKSKIDNINQEFIEPYKKEIEDYQILLKKLNISLFTEKEFCQITKDMVKNLRYFLSCVTQLEVDEKDLETLRNMEDFLLKLSTKL